MMVPRPQSLSHCYTEAQGKDMRKQKGKRGREEVQKWKDIYRILFPDDGDDIPEPCQYEHNINEESFKLINVQIAN